jgi:hypothetical protein
MLGLSTKGKSDMEEVSHKNCEIRLFVPLSTPTLLHGPTDRAGHNNEVGGAQ